MKQRFKFAIGASVVHREDTKLRIRTIVRRYMHQPPKNDVYWLDRPIQGLDYFNGVDLIRSQEERP